MRVRHAAVLAVIISEAFDIILRADPQVPGCHFGVAPAAKRSEREIRVRRRLAANRPPGRIVHAFHAFRIPAELAGPEPPASLPVSALRRSCRSSMSRQRPPSIQVSWISADRARTSPGQLAASGKIRTAAARRLISWFRHSSTFVDRIR